MDEVFVLSVHLENLSTFKRKSLIDYRQNPKLDMENQLSLDNQMSAIKTFNVKIQQKCQKPSKDDMETNQLRFIQTF